MSNPLLGLQQLAKDLDPGRPRREPAGNWRKQVTCKQFSTFLSPALVLGPRPASQKYQTYLAIHDTFFPSGPFCCITPHSFPLQSVKSRHLIPRVQNRHFAGVTQDCTPRVGCRRPLGSPLMKGPRVAPICSPRLQPRIATRRGEHHHDSSTTILKWRSQHRPKRTARRRL